MPEKVLCTNVNTGDQLMALGLGVLLAAVGELIASPALKLLAVPPEVHDLAATYLRIFLLGMPFLTLYNFEAAIFRSCGDGKTPLYSLVAANILNITLDLLSVTVLGWGLTGVVSATVLSFAVNSGILFVLLCRTPQPIRLQRHHMRLNGHEMGKILHIGLPAGIQGMVFALSNVVIQSSINSLGTAAMAAAAASVIIEFNIYCFVNGFSQATTTFVGQNYGARKLSRCLASTKAAFWVEGLFLLCITLPILFFGEHIIGFFNHDPEVIQLGMLRLWCVGDMLYLNGVVDIMSGALRGYGYSLPPAIVALIGICGVRLVWIYTVFVNHRDYLTLIMAYPVSWLATTVVLAAVYYQCRKYILKSALAGNKKRCCEKNEESFFSQHLFIQSRLSWTVVFLPFFLAANMNRSARSMMDSGVSPSCTVVMPRDMVMWRGVPSWSTEI